MKRCSVLPKYVFFCGVCGILTLSHLQIRITHVITLLLFISYLLLHMSAPHLAKQATHTHTQPQSGECGHVSSRVAIVHPPSKTANPRKEEDTPQSDTSTIVGPPDKTVTVNESSQTKKKKRGYNPSSSSIQRSRRRFYEDFLRSN